MRPDRRWIEGTVETSQSHLKITYGELSADTQPVPVALVSPCADETFVVQFLPLSELVDQKDEIRQNVIDDLDFYLLDQHLGPDPWAYLIYHATMTWANLYSKAHWVYYPAGDAS